MKRAAWMLAIGFGFTAMVAAQDSQTASQSAAKSGTITVTGCLQSGDGAGATGTTGSTSGTSASASRSTSGSANSASFILTQATMGSSTTSRSGSTAAGSTAGGATSAGSATGTSGTASTYILEPGSSQSELSSNTNKKVEVTGTLDTSMSGSSSSPSSAGAAGSTASSAAGSASGSMANAQHLKVASVRVLGESCR